MKVLLFVLQFVLIAHSAFANSSQANLGPEWKNTSVVNGIETWKSTKQESFIISVSDHRAKRTRTQRRAPAAVQPVEIQKLESFSKQRAQVIAKFGIKHWRVSKADLIAIDGKPALDLKGTYTGPSGASFCFSERQVDVGAHLKQVVITEMVKPSGCSWDQHTTLLSKFRFKH